MMLTDGFFWLPIAQYYPNIMIHLSRLQLPMLHFYLLYHILFSARSPVILLHNIAVLWRCWYDLSDDLSFHAQIKC